MNEDIVVTQPNGDVIVGKKPPFDVIADDVIHDYNGGGTSADILSDDHNI